MSLVTVPFYIRLLSTLFIVAERDRGRCFNIRNGQGSIALFDTVTDTETWQPDHPAEITEATGRV